MENFQFYWNRYSPQGADYIENILQWNYDDLERCHSYIQWLFPVDDEESKFNHNSKLITTTESELVCKNLTCSLRAIHSYNKMLNFWGFRLCHTTWKVFVGNEDRLRFLNGSRHNFLRITRVLKSMPLLGMFTLRQHFIDALYEQVLHGSLYNAYESMINYWLPLLSDASVPLENSALSVISSDVFTQFYTLSQVICVSNCLYAKLLLKHFCKVPLESCVFENTVIWLLVGERENEYIIMNIHTLRMKIVVKDNARHKFSNFLCFSGMNLNTWNYKGLWIHDSFFDIEDDEMFRIVSSSYVNGQKTISFVFFIV